MRALWGLLFFWVAPSYAGSSLDSLDFPASVRVEADTYRYRALEVRFPSAMASPFKANDTVWGHLYLPRPSRAARRPPPCILVLPVMAAPNVFIEMRFVHAFLMNRYAVMWIEMPYQFHRRPSPLVPSGQVFLARTAKRLAGNFRQSVADARRALTWLRASPWVDPDRIGLFGISLGALVGAAVISEDKRPRAAVLALGGADFPDLVRHSEMTADFIRKAGIRESDLRQAWAGLDPLEYRKTNQGKRVLLINARGDRVIPAENALKLKEAFPGARQQWIPFGHYGALLHLIWIPSYVAYCFMDLLR